MRQYTYRLNGENLRSVYSVDFNMSFLWQQTACPK